MSEPLQRESELPTSPEVDVEALSRLFDKRTNSYKFLFFLSLLDHLERTHFSKDVLDVDSVVVDMLVHAWYPHVYFKLSFGKQDQATRALDRITISSLTAANQFRPWEKDKIRERILSSGDSFGDLARFVPYRLIRPFFPGIRPKEDHVVNRMVAEASREYWATTRPLYRFETSPKQIKMHPAWLLYLRKNFAIVKGWVSWHYLDYMHKANPMVPGLSVKLFPPAHRQSLSSQTKYWRQIVSSSAVNCIYTGNRLRENDFCLDHFVPWSFVVHNQLWNLAPVSAAANSAKSDRLPSPKYFQPFIELQHTSLRLAASQLSSKAWEEIAAAYVAALNLPNFAAVSDQRIFHQAFSEVLQSQLSLARINGFEENWVFSGTPTLEKTN